MASLHWISYTIPADLELYQETISNKLTASLAAQLDGIYYRQLSLGYIYGDDGRRQYFLTGIRYSDGGDSGRMYNPQGKVVKLLVYS